jgi:4,5-DOPA dioxygenase extradiol
MISQLQKSNYKMPALFIGHGSPMNAIEENEFTKTLLRLGAELPKPKAVLVISAHWLTRGTFVNASPKPKMIFDMYGFPDELYRVEYPAPGSPEFANEVRNIIKNVDVQTDYEWGFDHGNWSILKWLFPNADVPVFQMSIDYHKPMKYHYELAQELKSLRQNGVLIIGSGNLTHNLRIVHFENKNNQPDNWAFEFDSKMKSFLDEKNHNSIIEYDKLGAASRLAVPEPSHFIPLIYSIGLQDDEEKISYFYDKFEYGTLSMRSFVIE